MIHQDPKYLCEICKAELSYEWVHHYFDMLDYHTFCSTHKDAYLEVKSNVVIVWDGERFVAGIGEAK